MSLVKQLLLPRKYRAIVYAVGFFLVFDLGVLILNFYTSYQITEDAISINLAGRQRMLLQQISRLVIELDSTGNQQTVGEIQTSQETFQQTLYALRDGGHAPYFSSSQVILSPTHAPQILDQITLVENDWQKLRTHLAILTSSPPDTAAFSQAFQTIKDTIPGLVDQVDQMVYLYEQQASGRVYLLRNVQIAFVVCALALLLSGFWATRYFILRPMGALGQAAQQIGAGALETPVKVSGDAEIELLGTAMEEMRRDLLASKSELLRAAATLEERVIQRTQELESLQEVSHEITSRLDIKSVLNSIVDKARILLNADVAFLCLLNSEESLLSLQSNSGPAQAISQTTNPIKASWAEDVISGETAVCHQAGNCTGDCGVVDPTYRLSQLAAPLRYGERAIGALCVASRQENFFSSDAADLLTRLANIASLALENATLYTQLERSTMLEERHRIAAEMHDGLAQTLSFLRLAIEQTETHLASGYVSQAQHSLSQAHSGLDQAAIDIRRAIASLHDEYPTQFTLQEQLGSLIQEIDGSRQQVHWENSTKAPLILKVQDAEQVLRVVREALINAQKYSQATQIEVRLEQVDGCGSVRIRDNGIGFDAYKTEEDDRPHFGVKIMQARAARLHGHLDINSHRQLGTQITLTWPLEADPTDG